MSLVCRQALSVPRAIYTFISDCYGVFRVPWPSVLRELWIVRGILPLLHCSISGKVSTDIIAHDASSNGWGIVRGKASVGQVSEWSRWNENWRFKRLSPSEWAPRRRVFTQYPNLSPHPLHDVEPCVLSDPVTAFDDVFPDSSIPIPSELGWAMRSRFPEIAPEIDNLRFSCIKRGFFKYKEDITVKEARTFAWAFIDSANNVQNHQSTQLYIIDNFGACCALMRGRAQSFGLLQVIRRVAAVRLSTGLIPWLRWVPSEIHPADKDSRFFESKFAGPPLDEPTSNCRGSCTSSAEAVRRLNDQAVHHQAAARLWYLQQGPSP